MTKIQAIIYACRPICAAVICEFEWTFSVWRTFDLLIHTNSNTYSWYDFTLGNFVALTVCQYSIHIDIDKSAQISVDNTKVLFIASVRLIRRCSHIFLSRFVSSRLASFIYLCLPVGVFVYCRANFLKQFSNFSTIPTITAPICHFMLLKYLLERNMSYTRWIDIFHIRHALESIDLILFIVVQQRQRQWTSIEIT